MKTRKIIQLILDAIILIALILGLSWAIFIFHVDFKIFASLFSFLISICVFITVFIDFVLNIRFFIKGKANKSTVMQLLKFICAVGAFSSFLTTVCYLQYYNLDLKDPGFLIVNITLNYIVPILISANYIFLEVDNKHRFRLTFLGPTFLFVYALYMLPLVNFNIISDPYGFLSFNDNKWYISLIYVLCFIVAAFALSILFYGLNHLFYLVYGNGNEQTDSVKDVDLEGKTLIIKKEKDIVSDNYQVSDNENESAIDNKNNSDSANSKLETEEVDQEKEKDSLNSDTNIKDEETAIKDNRGKIYHISYRKEDKKWAVKFEKGKRALKLFKTQNEAIDFAKEMAKKQDGSYRVHSLKGKIRKG